MSLRIAVVGGGVMGETMLTAMKAGGQTDLVVAEKSPERADYLTSTYGVEVVEAAEAVSGADVVLLVVKPHDVTAVLQDIAPYLRQDVIVVSLAAGVTTAACEAALGAEFAVIRVMPNTPAVVSQGMFGLSVGSACSQSQLALVRGLVENGGEVVVVDEQLQDALTAVSGSGPAYVFYLAEAMIAGGVEAGLDEATARMLTQQTLVGAAALLADSDDTPAELRRRVTSPNGTTAAAIAAFDERGVKDGLIAGVLAAAKRSAELSS